MIPIRYGSFALSYERLNDPKRWLTELVAERDLEDYVVPIANGESRIFVRPDNAKPRFAMPVQESVEVDLNSEPHTLG